MSRARQKELWGVSIGYNLRFLSLLSLNLYLYLCDIVISWKYINTFIHSRVRFPSALSSSLHCHYSFINALNIREIFTNLNSFNMKYLQNQQQQALTPTGAWNLSYQQLIDKTSFQIQIYKSLFIPSLNF